MSFAQPRRVDVPVTPPATLGSLVKEPKTAFPLVVMLALLGLAVANISLRATWQELEDGVLWVSGQGGVVAADVADGAPGARAGISREIGRAHV